MNIKRIFTIKWYRRVETGVDGLNLCVHWPCINLYLFISSIKFPFLIELLIQICKIKSFTTVHQENIIMMVVVMLLMIAYRTSGGVSLKSDASIKPCDFMCCSLIAIDKCDYSVLRGEISWDCEYHWCVKARSWCWNQIHVRKSNQSTFYFYT